MSADELISLLLSQGFWCVIYSGELYAAFADQDDAEECLRIQQIVDGGFEIQYPG